MSPFLIRLALLAAQETTTSQEVRSKWLYILLAWLYENKDMFEDPLAIVEEIYVEFDYPEEIAHLIRYMPIEEADLGSKEANLGRLVTRWGEFVNQGRIVM